MTVPLKTGNLMKRPKRRGRSAAALATGFVTTFVLTTAVDAVLHALNVYGSWSEPLVAPGLIILALSYRLVFDTLGSYIAARMAPSNPMRHALILGGIGAVLSALGIVASARMHLGAIWYPIVLTLSVMPTAWLGGWLFEQTATETT